MGGQGRPETVVGIYQAFLRQRTWSQASLATEIGIGRPALRKWLEELSRTGMPLHRDEDHPHVYWSVPPNWFPGAIALRPDEGAELVRQLFRLPRSKGRDQLLRRLNESTSNSPGAGRERGVVSQEFGDLEELALPVVEDAVLAQNVLAFRYYSVERGAFEARAASIQRVLPGPPARFLALCHRDHLLKWYRVGRVAHPRLDPQQGYVVAPAEDVQRKLDESVLGFHGGGPPIECAFVVREPDARWVRENLPAPMAATPTVAGLRLTVTTAALLPLARFVVGLGGAARVETPALRDLVEELARGALLR